MQPVPLESTLLASVSYDGQRHLLDVVFRSGELYRYFNVPSACYQGLLGADSKGNYFNLNIRNCFPYQHLSPESSSVVLAATKTK
jgi:KTSC domain